MSLAALSRVTREMDLLLTEQSYSVYLLALSGEIVYVGQTKELAQRIGDHRRRMPFDHVRWFGCKKQERLRYEGALIRALRPRFNKRAPRWLGRDNETLIELGLEPHADERANAHDWYEKTSVKHGPLPPEEKKRRTRLAMLRRADRCVSVTLASLAHVYAAAHGVHV